MARQLQQLISGELDEQFRRDAEYVSGLDPDLAVNRSLSWVAKVRIQRERNFQRRKENERHWLLKKVGA